MENLNKIAVDITRREGKLQNMTIAQVKEIIAVIGMRWREMPFGDVLREVAAIYEKAGMSNEGEVKDEN